MRKLNELQKRAITKNFTNASVLITIVEKLGDESIKLSNDVLTAIDYIEDRYGWKCSIKS